MDSRTKQIKAWNHGTVSQIPRNSLIMLMAACAIVVFPLIPYISLWIIAAGLYCAWWRWMIFLGRKNFPSFWLKTALVTASGAGVIVSEGITKNLETWAALLIVAFALKLLEMKTQRDAYVVIFIAYFIIAVEFIFNHSMGIVAYEFCALVLVTASMVGMNQFHTRVKPIESVKIATKILAQAIPLMVVLFLLFPRMGPIWAIASPNQKARTGLSAQMTPGDIASLARSDEIVFRAIFKDSPPPNSDLYWRGRVYANFKNGTWSEAEIPKQFQNIPKVDWSNNNNVAWFVPDTRAKDNISYSILLEPTYDQWLFGLDLALSTTPSTGLFWDYRLINRVPVQKLLQYDVDTYPNTILNTWLPEFLRLQTTNLDAEDNPQIVNFSRNLYNQSENTEEFVEKILNHIRNQPYYYTLEPPTLDLNHSVDQFWFDTRAGFCTHYAGAFVLIMRAAGIPARMVGGYQGGEINPVTGHVVVRQYLAHAWAEIWLPTKGWRRIDPTAAVAPSRIQEGLTSALPEEDFAALSAFTNVRLNRVLGLQKIMFMLESLEHRWNLFVVGYNSERQTDFLKKLFGKITFTKIALVLFAGALVSIMFVAISLLSSHRPRKQHPVIILFQVFAKRLQKHKLNRNPEETPAQFINKISIDRGLAEKDYQPTIKMLNELLFNPSEHYTKEKMSLLKRNLQQLQLKISLKPQ